MMWAAHVGGRGNLWRGYGDLCPFDGDGDLGGMSGAVGRGGHGFGADPPNIDATVHPDDMRGRVGATTTLFVSASNDWARWNGCGGILAGPGGAAVFGGVASIVVAIAWARLFPELISAKGFENHPAR
jgi:hypothetical protein